MKLEDCLKRVSSYLRKEDYNPRFINVENTYDMAYIKDYFDTGENIFISVSSYAKKDELPIFEDLEQDLSAKQGNIFITGLTSYLKLLGENEFESKINSFKTNTYDAHIVFLCYQSKTAFQKWGSREQRLIYDVDGTKTTLPTVVLVPEKRNIDEDISKEKICIGIENIFDAIETIDAGKLFVKTNKSKNLYNTSLIKIKGEDCAYDTLCEKDKITKSLLKSYGTEIQWIYALELVDKYGSWYKVFEEEFAVPENLSLVLGEWNTFDTNKKWLYFIALKICGSGKNKILKIAIEHTESADKLIRSIYRSLLNIEITDTNFWNLYNERKSLLNKFGESDTEILDYIQIIRAKEEKGLFYLTDITQNEKEYIFELLSKYYHLFKRKEIEDILSKVYPALYAYLLPYNFKNEFMNKYFQDYKYQKVVNKISDEFIKNVENQAISRDYNSWLAPRAEVVDRLDKTNSRLYFVDAMGVEYLGYIINKCQKMNLIADISVCRCELPSLTIYNKEFIESFNDIAPDIKALDNIKHHGTDGFDYRNKKLPVHLIKELEIIDSVLDDIRKRISNDNSKRAFIISDHGASRLAVINEHENKWEMQENGKHCGRCCPISEADVQSEYATSERNFWILANYDRFKGGRPGSVEVHGGATLEEITVPIIEISYKNCEYEVMIDSKIPIEISYKKKANIILFSKTKIAGITVSVKGKRLENKFYDVIPIGNNKYSIDMPDLKFAGEYQLEVFTNGYPIAKLPFTVKKEGVSERSIL